MKKILMPLLLTKKIMKNTLKILAIITLVVIAFSICGCEKDNEKNHLVGTWVKCHDVMGDPSNYDENGDPIVHLCDPGFLKERMKNDPNWDVITFTKRGIMYNNRYNLYDNKPYTMEGDSIIIVDGKYHLYIKLFDKKGMVICCWEPTDGFAQISTDVVFTKIK